MNKLIVGCGYLGRLVAQRWLADGHNVSALTRSAQNASQFEAMGINPVEGDVTKPETLGELPKAETVLIAIGFDRSAAPTKHDVYVTGLHNVLKRCADWSHRLIYISSVSVYGQSNGEWIDESSPREPSSENGQICLEAEQLIHEFYPASAASKVRSANILRLAGIYGPQRLLSRIDALKAGQSLTGRPDSWLNLIHVSDAATTVVQCDKSNSYGEDFLVSDNHPVERRKYYQRLAELVGAPEPVFDPTKKGQRTQGRNKRCRNQKIREILGVHLAYPTYEAGLTQSVSP